VQLSKEGRSSHRKLWAIYVLPVALFSLSVVPTTDRFWIFGLGLTLPLIEMLVMRWSARDIGFRVDTLLPYLLPYVIFTTIMTVGLILLAILMQKAFIYHTYKWWILPPWALLFF
jgi:hypothetical protein